MALRFAAVHGCSGSVRSVAIALGRAVAAWACLAACACDRPPSVDSLTEWTPRDHHSNDDDKLAQQRAGGAGRSAKGDSTPSDIAQLVDLAWRQQCTTCHGPAGRGDGQMGPMLQAPDLTNDQWQARVTDTDMARAIQNGKNRMPSSGARCAGPVASGKMMDAASSLSGPPAAVRVPVRR
jgi:mono/diheme cytochrome c family protein